MGWGDQLLASGLARGAKERGKRIAFGDKRKIIWDSRSPDIFRGNPNIASPGSEGADDLDWVRFYKGHRIYNRQAGDRWEWNYDFKAIPGEMFFDDRERQESRRYGKGFILIEPALPPGKSVAPNKDWGARNYQIVADRLRNDGHRVVQFSSPGSTPLQNVQRLRTRSFRDAVSIIRHAKLYIGPEGGLHHAAGAARIPGVVLFGGFIPPQVTGYDIHTNLTGGAEACGSLRPCKHCADAMARISVDEVLDAARERL